MRRKLAWLLLLPGVLAAPPADADCDGVGCYCSIAATPVAFGLYDAVTRQQVDSTGTIQVTCGAADAGTRISYELTLSTGGSGNYGARAMASGPNLLGYNLYTKANRKKVWGDGTGGSDIVTDKYKLKVPCCETRSYTIYGRIDGGQNAAPGYYFDTIVITINW